MSRGEQFNPAGRSEHVQRMVEDWYHRPGGPPSGGAAVWQPLPPDILRVKLTADWKVADNGDPGDDGEAVEVEVQDDGTLGETQRTVYLRAPLDLANTKILLGDHANWTVKSGTYLLVRDTYDGPGPDKVGPYYEPIDLGYPPFLNFELKTDIAPGGSAYAYPMLDNGSDADTDADTFTVYDAPEGNRRARGRDSTGSSSGNHGARGKAHFNAFTKKWEIVSMQVLSKECAALTAVSFDKTSTDFTVYQVSPLDDEQSPVNTSSDVLTVQNWAKWSAKNDTPCHIVPNGSGGWRFEQGPCIGDM